MLDARSTSTPKHETYLKVGHFTALDGLRAVAVVAVIWQHTAGFNNGKGLLARGYMGVDCFFVISGFLITTLLLREHAKHGRMSMRGFYLRRAARILPIYYAVLAVYAALYLATNPADKAEFMHNLPLYATYTSNWWGAGGNHATFYFAWSLATEEQFYLLWPPILLACLAYTRRWVYPVAVLAALVLVDQVAAVAGWRIVASLATPILLGAAAALTLHQPRGYRWMARWLGSRLAAPVALLVALAVLQAEIGDVAGELALAVLVIALVVREDTLLHPVLRWRPLVLVGTISYGMYLMQLLAANLVRPVVGHRLGVDVFAGATVVVAGLAYVSYRWFETPIREAVRSWAST